MFSKIPPHSPTAQEGKIRWGTLLSPWWDGLRVSNWALAEAEEHEQLQHSPPCFLTGVGDCKWLRSSASQLNSASQGSCDTPQASSEYKQWWHSPILCLKSAHVQGKHFPGVAEALGHTHSRYFPTALLKLASVYSLYREHPPDHLALAAKKAGVLAFPSSTDCNNRKDTTWKSTTHRTLHRQQTKIKTQFSCEKGLFTYPGTSA